MPPCSVCQSNETDTTNPTHQSHLRKQKCLREEGRGRGGVTGRRETRPFCGSLRLAGLSLPSAKPWSRPPKTSLLFLGLSPPTSRREKAVHVKKKQKITRLGNEATQEERKVSSSTVPVALGGHPNFCMKLGRKKRPPAVVPLISLTNDCRVRNYVGLKNGELTVARVRKVAAQKETKYLRTSQS